MISVLYILIFIMRGIDRKIKWFLILYFVGAQGEVPNSVKKLLPKLRNEEETEVIIVTLAETTPVYEAIRLQEDLQRAKIHNKWWVVNASMYATNTTNQILEAKSKNEIQWINKVNGVSKGNFAVISWFADEIKKETIAQLLH